MLTQHCVRAAMAAGLTLTAFGASAAAVTDNKLNPAISLILDGRYAAFSQDPATYGIAGFSLAGETGELTEGLHIGESELTLGANVDDLFYGQFTAAYHEAVEIEEAYVETLSLGGGATLRGGRFRSGIGYSNPQHAHAWDFVDQALPFRALIGAHGLIDDGVQLRWVAPTDLFIELGGELLRGEGFPAGGAARDGKGSRALFARVGGDVGASHAWRVGVSRLTADAVDRESGDEAAPDLFAGDVTLSILDFVWKWAPNGNAKERNLKFQAEYFKREETGEYDLGSAGAPAAFDGEQRGWYAQTVYQFMPRWRAGVRYAIADAGEVDPAFAGTVLDAAGHKPKATSVMLDYSHTEFSRLRLQFTRDESRAAETDNQVTLQYTMSLGPHGAHAF
jgi:hypothetical protein